MAIKRRRSKLREISRVAARWRIWGLLGVPYAIGLGALAQDCGGSSMRWTGLTMAFGPMTYLSLPLSPVTGFLMWVLVFAMLTFEDRWANRVAIGIVLIHYASVAFAGIADPKSLSLAETWHYVPWALTAWMAWYLCGQACIWWIFVETRRQRYGCCVTCGYDLRRCTSTTCPECGHPAIAER